MSRLNTKLKQQDHIKYIINLLEHFNNDECKYMKNSTLFYISYIIKFCYEIYKHYEINKYINIADIPENITQIIIILNRISQQVLFKENCSDTFGNTEYLNNMSFLSCIIENKTFESNFFKIDYIEYSFDLYYIKTLVLNIKYIKDTITKLNDIVEFNSIVDEDDRNTLNKSSKIINKYQDTISIDIEKQKDINFVVMLVNTGMEKQNIMKEYLNIIYTNLHKETTKTQYNKYKNLLNIIMTYTKYAIIYFYDVYEICKTHYISSKIPDSIIEILTDFIRSVVRYNSYIDFFKHNINTYKQFVL